MISLLWTLSGSSSFNARYRITEARCRFWKRLKSVKSKRERSARICTVGVSLSRTPTSAGPANWCIVGNCRLNPVAVRISPSISKSCSMEYNPSQTKMYFYAYQVWISWYLEATKRDATPKSWRLCLLTPEPEWTIMKSMIWTQICMVYCWSWNFLPTWSSQRRRTVRIYPLTPSSPPSDICNSNRVT